MKKWGFLDQNQSELSFFQKKTKKISKKKKWPWRHYLLFNGYACIGFNVWIWLMSDGLFNRRPTRRINRAGRTVRWRSRPTDRLPSICRRKRSICTWDRDRASRTASTTAPTPNITPLTQGNTHTHTSTMQISILLTQNSTILSLKTKTIWQLLAEPWNLDKFRPYSTQNMSHFDLKTTILKKIWHF